MMTHTDERHETIGQPRRAPFGAVQDPPGIRITPPFRAPRSAPPALGFVVGLPLGILIWAGIIGGIAAILHYS